MIETQINTEIRNKMNMEKERKQREKEKEHGEMYVKQMHIAEYRFGSYANHEAKRDRKLLLQRREIRKLEKATKDTGKTIIPLELCINDKGLAKMEIALCQGKHTYDKRQALREADDKRQIDQIRKLSSLR